MRILTHGLMLLAINTNALFAAVLPIMPGENIWCITNRIEQTVDEIAATICQSQTDQLITTRTCAPMPISAPTTITAPGAYCLASNFSGGMISIQSDNVALDLSGRAITNANAPGITIANSTNVAVFNGVVSATNANAIEISDSQTITLAALSVEKANTGALLSRVGSGSISGCDFSFNGTGLVLQDSNFVIIDASTATNNRSAGFSLIGAAHNCLRSCMALNNGFESLGDSFGFVSANGSANMFANCIADSTQTTTTNFCAVAAGFALLGTEQCSKIVECTSTNAFGPFETALVGNQTAVYSALPCGIYLQAQTTNPVLAELNVGNTDLGSIFSVNWSPDGKYLAIGAFNIPGDDDVRVYQFDPAATPALTQLTGGNTDIGDISSVNWSPDGTYLAIGANNISGNDIRVYQFDPAATPVLTQLNVGDTNIGDIRSVNWSPNGTYLAIGANNISGNDIRVYQFDPAATPVLTQLNVGDTNIGDIRSVAWSPDGTYLAVGGNITSGSDQNDIRVYQFDPAATPALTLLAVGNTDIGGISSVNWSPDGKYLAIGTFNISDDDIRVYHFDPAANPVLTLLAGGNTDIGIINSVNWSGDGKYLAIGANNIIRVYQFDPAATPALTLLPGGNTDLGFILSVNWSPDGNYLAAGVFDITGNDIRVYSVLQFPLKNFIHNNTVTCNSTANATCPRGTGISGSSRSNCIISNTSYNNPFNYTFVTNTHTQLLQGNFSPSAVQNVSLNGCDPICTPENLATLSNLTAAKICATQRGLVIVESVVDAL